MSIPETNGEAREFNVIYGFTQDPEQIPADALQFEGILKITPERIGIYRTGDRMNPTDDQWTRYGRAIGHVDTVLDTEGTPEHIIDPETTTAMVDWGRGMLVLKVAGATHFVLKARGGLLGGGGDDITREMVGALERRMGKQAVRLECRRTYSGWLIFVIVAVVLVVLLELLSLLSR